ncbi:MAG: radical SAM protein [Candidatus Nanopelagicales bacterium]
MAADSPGLLAADVVGALDDPVGAYLHVPFCERICPFCPYNKVVPRGDQPTRYFHALRSEVDRYLAAGAADVSGSGGFTSLYVGGGTPTLFPDELAGLVRQLPVTGERAIEVLPTHGTPCRLDALHTAGFTAVSIGAQSFHDEVLHRLRRPHDARTARAAVQAAVGRFPLVDVDLIVDVELDDALSGAFLADLRACFELGVDQASTYPLMRFGYTPFGTGAQNRRREHEVLAEAAELAREHGYERRSVWTFNRLDSATYTSITRRRFLGMGAGASSFTGRDFYVNHFGVQTYIEAAEGSALPLARWLHLGAAAGLAYDAFWQAYAGGIDLATLDAAYGRWSQVARAALPPLVAAGLVHREDGHFTVTGRGFDRFHDLERWVTYQMIEPLWAEMLREHEREGCAATWATVRRARSGRIWRMASSLMERPV